MKKPLLVKPAYLDLTDDEQAGFICIPIDNMAIPVCSKSTARKIIDELSRDNMITDPEKTHLLDSVSESEMPQDNPLGEVIMEARAVISQCGVMLDKLIAAHEDSASEEEGFDPNHN